MKTACEFEGLNIESKRVTKEISDVYKELSELAKTHINSLPKSLLWGNADETGKKKSIYEHYKFVEKLNGKLTTLGKYRPVMLRICEGLDELASQTEYEGQEEISKLGSVLLDVQRRVDETETVSGRFLSELDRAIDVLHKGEHADFRIAEDLCLRYFEFTSKTGFYIDNPKLF